MGGANLEHLGKSYLSESYLNALLKGDRKACTAVVESFQQTDPSIKNLYETLIKPALYEVGSLWERNEISVAAEHMATAITEGILNSLYEKNSHLKRKQSDRFW